MSERLSTTFDDASGVILVEGSGFWTPEQASAHFRELERMIVTLRAQHGSVAVLVDLREAAVQRPDTAGIISAATARIYRAADRVALVASTTLLSMQMKRAAKVETMRTFLDMAEATAWINPPAARSQAAG